MKKISENIYLTPNPKDVEVPAQKCPGCGANLDVATQIAGESDTGEVPQPGAYSMCAYCAQVIIMRDDMRWHVPSLSELASLPADIQKFLSVMQSKIMELRKILPHQLENDKPKP